MINDKSLLVLLRLFLREIKKSAANGEPYPVFPPLKIEIISKTDIRYAAVPGAKNLRECLRYLGASLYHLKAGESEFNNESFAFDGYPPLGSEFWPVLSLMLSGNAASISQIEEMISFKRRFGDKAAKLAKSAVVKLAAVSSFVRQTLKNKSIAAFNFLKARWAADRDKAKRFLFWFLFLGGIPEIIWYFWFNWNFSTGGGMIFFTILFGVFAVWKSLTVLEKINRPSAGGPFNWGPISWRVNFSLILAAALYALSSCSFLLANDLVATGAKLSEELVLVDRKSGEFVSRLPKDASDKISTWDNFYINHLKRKIVPGIPVSGEITGLSVDFSRENYRYGAKFIAVYEIEKEQYKRIWEKFQNRQNFEDALKKEITEKTASVLRERFRPLAEKYGNDSVSALDAVLRSAEFEKKKKDFDGGVRKIFEETTFEIEGVKIKLVPHFQ